MVAQDRINDHKAAAPEPVDEPFYHANLGGAAQETAVDAVEADTDLSPVVRNMLHLICQVQKLPPEKPVWADSRAVGSGQHWQPIAESTGRAMVREHRPKQERSWMAGNTGR